MHTSDMRPTYMSGAVSGNVSREQQQLNDHCVSQSVTRDSKEIQVQATGVTFLWHLQLRYFKLPECLR